MLIGHHQSDRYLKYSGQSKAYGCQISFLNIFQYRFLTSHPQIKQELIFNKLRSSHSMLRAINLSWPIYKGRHGTASGKILNWIVKKLAFIKANNNILQWNEPSHNKNIKLRDTKGF